MAIPGSCSECGSSVPDWRHFRGCSRGDDLDAKVRDLVQTGHVDPAVAEDFATQLAQDLEDLR